MRCGHTWWAFGVRGLWRCSEAAAGLPAPLERTIAIQRSSVWGSRAGSVAGRSGAGAPHAAALGALPLPWGSAAPAPGPPRWPPPLPHPPIHTQPHMRHWPARIPGPAHMRRSTVAATEGDAVGAGGPPVLRVNGGPSPGQQPPQALPPKSDHRTRPGGRSPVASTEDGACLRRVWGGWGAGGPLA